MIPVVNEGSTHMVSASFADEDGNPVIPTSGTYRVDDVASDTALVEPTAFTPTAAEQVITIPHTANRILSAARAWEERRLTLTFVYAGGQGSGDYLYKVKNLGGVV
jgi:hypothetical protein